MPEAHAVGRVGGEPCASISCMKLYSAQWHRSGLLRAALITNMLLSPEVREWQQSSRFFATQSISPYRGTPVSQTATGLRQPRSNGVQNAATPFCKPPRRSVQRQPPWSSSTAPSATAASRSTSLPPCNVPSRWQGVKPHGGGGLKHRKAIDGLPCWSRASATCALRYPTLAGGSIARQRAPHSRPWSTVEAAVDAERPRLVWQ